MSQPTCTCDNAGAEFPHRPWCATEHQHPGPDCAGLCEPAETAARRCQCPAWHPDNDHTEAEHTSCSGYHRCGGCDECVSATVRHGQWGREEMP